MNQVTALGWLGITGSAGYDVAACPPRMAFPQVREPAGEPAVRGTALHLFAQQCTEDPKNREQHLSQVPDEWRHTARGMVLEDALDGITVQGCEVAFALDVKAQTCRLIGYNIERKYAETLEANGEPPLGLYEIPFTVDVLGTASFTGVPAELDYKSGQYVGEVEEHGQRRISAAGIMFYRRADAALSRIVYIKEDGTMIPDEFEFTIFDAYETCETMVKAIDAVIAARELFDRGIIPTVYPDRDKQCRYCSAFDYCPYWTNLARQTVIEVQAKAIPSVEDITAMSPEERGLALDRAKNVLKVFRDIEEKLRQAAYKGPLPIDDKYEYRAEGRDGKHYFDDAAMRGEFIKLLYASGLDQEEVDAYMAKFQKQAAGYPEVRKRKRVLPVIKKSA